MARDSEFIAIMVFLNRIAFALTDAHTNDTAKMKQIIDESFSHVNAAHGCEIESDRRYQDLMVKITQIEQDDTISCPIIEGIKEMMILYNSVSQDMNKFAQALKSGISKQNVPINGGYQMVYQISPPMFGPSPANVFPTWPLPPAPQFNPQALNIPYGNTPVITFSVNY